MHPGTRHRNPAEQGGDIGRPSVAPVKDPTATTATTATRCRVYGIGRPPGFRPELH